jgi:hypothetical protein
MRGPLEDGRMFPVFWTKRTTPVNDGLRSPRLGVKELPLVTVRGGSIAPAGAAELVHWGRSREGARS